MKGIYWKDIRCLASSIDITGNVAWVLSYANMSTATKFRAILNPPLPPSIVLPTVLEYGFHFRSFTFAFCLRNFFL